MTDTDPNLKRWFDICFVMLLLLYLICPGQKGEQENESYEDSDQTPLQGREAMVLRYQWAGGSIAHIYT